MAEGAPNTARQRTDLIISIVVRRQGQDNAVFIGDVARKSDSCEGASSCRDTASESIINAQDLAMAHLYYEKALRERPQEVAGEGL